MVLLKVTILVVPSTTTSRSNRYLPQVLYRITPWHSSTRPQPLHRQEGWRLIFELRNAKVSVCNCRSIPMHLTEADPLSVEPLIHSISTSPNVSCSIRGIRATVANSLDHITTIT